MIEEKMISVRRVLEIVKDVRDSGMFLDGHNGLFLRVEDLDDLERAIKQEVEDA